jgi:hypothetical protein
MSLQNVKAVRLVVPQLYNLQPCRIELQGVVGSEVENLQEAFKIQCVEHASLSLIAHINFLSQNMHVMTASVTAPEKPPDIQQPAMSQPLDDALPKQVDATVEDAHRSHIITIPRPPEWDVNVDDQSSDSDESYSSDSEGEGSEDTARGQPEQQSETSQPQRGILMSFPHLEMHGIELLEVFSVSLEIKCERCKTQMDIQNVKNNAKVTSAALRTESCRKCANVMSIGTYHSYTIKIATLTDMKTLRLQNGFDTRKFCQSRVS